MSQQGWRNSLHGRAVEYDKTFLYLFGKPIGNPIVGRGRYIYVDSAIDATGGHSPIEAVGTLDEAFAKCTANRGDVIVVMPNHAETVTGVGGITHDVAGVSVIGLGNQNQRPRFLMDGGTTVTYVISAADAYLENLEFASGHASVVTCFDLTATGATFNAIEFTDNTTSEFFLVCIKATSTTDENASGLTVTNCKRVTAEAATDFISLIADVTNLTVTNNYYCADAATGAGLILCATGKDIRGLKCEWNTFICGNTTTDLLIDNDTSVNTGYAANNLIGHHDVAAAIVIDCDGIRQFNNLSCNNDTSSGILLPLAGVDT